MSTIKKILVIEDDQAIGDSFEATLLTQKYEVVRAVNGVQGLAMAKSEKPDLVLLDVMLPDKTGEEVIDALQADEATRNIPVIVDSNLYSQERELYFLQKGAKAYVVKSSITPQSLLALVAKA